MRARQPHGSPLLETARPGLFVARDPGVASLAADPVLLVLEDLHWGDLSAVRLVDTMLRELAFRHALLREGAYAMLTEEDRVLGHRLAAEWRVPENARTLALAAELLDG